jgi:hypothetical protein
MFCVLAVCLKRLFPQIGAIDITEYDNALQQVGTNETWLVQCGDVSVPRFMDMFVSVFFFCFASPVCVYAYVYLVRLHQELVRANQSTSGVPREWGRRPALRHPRLCVWHGTCHVRDYGPSPSVWSTLVALVSLVDI